MLQYTTQSRAYKLWDVTKREVVVSRDVVFENVDDPSVPTDSPEKDQIEIIGPSVDVESGADIQGETENADVSTAQQGGRAESHTPQAPIHVSEASTPTAENYQNEDSDHSADATSTTNAPRRSTRIRKPPGSWWKATAALVLASPPDTFAEDTEGRKSEAWMTAMKSEMSSLHKNNTWTLVPRDKACNVLTPKWVYRKKEVHTADGNNTMNYKARVCARGFQQVYGVDYTETFAPVVKFTSIRTLLSLVAVMDLELEQMDVVTAFLNGDLDEDIYMEQPEGFRDSRYPDHVCKLLKALYGLKQAPRQWHAKIDSFLVHKLGFTCTAADACLYIRCSGNRLEIIALYVDDLLIAGNDVAAVAELKKELGDAFEMKDLGAAKVCLGLEISRNRNKRQLFLGQKKYVGTVLERFGMQNCKAVATPMESGFDITEESEPAENVPYREAIGSLMYLMIGSRPDLAFAVGKLSQFVEKPQTHHWVAVKRILRYIQGTSRFGILYGLNSAKLTLEGYCDSDWGGNRTDRKSTSGFVFKIANAAVSWASRKQSVVALSSTEAEYISMCEAAKEAVWLGYIWSHIGNEKKGSPIKIEVDNQGAICMAKNSGSSRRTKHVDIRYHFVRDQVQAGKVKFEYCRTEDMEADIFTKPLARVKFEQFRDKIGLRCASDM